MPARTNPFQELIARIESQLAPAGASVTESAMIYDSASGQHREVDVLIEYKLRVRKIRVGVECRDHKRPQGVEWVEQVHAKHSNLNLNASVLVSNSGFTKSAYGLASRWNIELLTLEQATGTDWAKRIGALPVYLSVYRPPQITGIAARSHSFSSPNEVPLSKAELFSDEKYVGPVADVAAKFVANERTTATIEDVTSQWGTSDFSVSLRPTQPLWMRVDGGELTSIAELLITGISEVVDVEVQLTPAVYSKREIAYGEGSYEGARFQIYVVRYPGSDLVDINIAADRALAELIDMQSLKLRLMSPAYERRVWFDLFGINQPPS